jgi:peroxiredoxin
MARTPSTMLPLGSPLPSFALPEPLTGRVISSAELQGKPAVVIFICNHCPFVKHIRVELARFGVECRDRGVGMVAISSNDIVTHPEDSPEAMAREAREFGYVFPYLFDESQDVARSFQAACTPDLYIFDAAARLAYRGQFDPSRPGNGVPVTGRDARAAVDALVLGQTPAPHQIPSIGCNIKWKPQRAPST